jgi:hypothetical protein
MTLQPHYSKLVMEILTVSLADTDMGKRISLHRLDNVDMVKRTAVCFSCGPTEISVRRDLKHPDRPPRVFCINRIREITRNSIRRVREKARLQNPNWKPKHSLSEIDPSKMRAICAICGPTDILKNGLYRNQPFLPLCNQSTPIRT